MNILIKEAGFKLNNIIKNKESKNFINTAKNRFYGLVCDSLIGVQYNNVKKLIKKGLDSGAYEIIINSSNYKNVIERAKVILVQNELMDDFNAKQAIGIILIAIDNSDANIKFVEKYIGEETNKSIPIINNTQVNKVDNKLNEEINNYFKRINIFLDNKEWDRADEYAEKILDKNPECSKAYVMKLMAELKISKEILLGEGTTPQIGCKINFKNACKFASSEELAKLKEYEYRNAYEHGKRILNNAKTETNYRNAASWFILYPKYKDSKELYDKCIANAERIKKQNSVSNTTNINTTKTTNTLSNTNSQNNINKNITNYNNTYHHRYYDDDVWKKVLFYIFLVILIAGDIFLCHLFGHTPKWRWLWLPLIGVGIGVISGFIACALMIDCCGPSVLILFLNGIITALIIAYITYIDRDEKFFQLIPTISVFIWNLGFRMAGIGALCGINEEF